MKGPMLESFPKQKIVLKHSLALTISDKDKSGTEIDKREVIQFLSKEMCKSFGGMKQWVEEGIYLNKNGDMIYEVNTILKSWCADDQKEKVNKILRQYFDLLSTALNQEAAAYWIDNDLFIIDLNNNDHRNLK